jgi:hypothetical protein
MAYQATSSTFAASGLALFCHTRFPQRLGFQVPWYLPYIDGSCQIRMGGGVEIHEHELPGREDAGSPQSMLIYEAIEVTNDVVPYSISMADSTFQNPQLILIPCQSLSLESITCIQPCFRSIIDIAEKAFDTAIDKP